MFWFHGVGVCTCPGRGYVRWGNDAYDYDGVEVLAFLFFPLLPLRAIHVTRNSPYRRDAAQGDRQEWPIRFTPGLVARAFAARWAWLLLILGILMALGGMTRPRPAARFVGLVASGLCLGGFFLTRAALSRADTRNQSIRLLLGRHHLGSSDPAYWRARRFEDGVRPEALYGTTSFAEAVPKLLAEGEWSRAMWAARLCVALEDRAAGEEATDLILDHPGVSEALKVIEQEPRLWRRLTVRGASRAFAPAAPG